MRGQMRMLRKIIILAAIFILLTFLIIFCPVVTQWDRSLIMFVQDHLSFSPLWVPMLPDCILYSAMIIVPIAGFGIFFIKKRLWKDLILFCSVPLVTFLLNCILKPLVHRSRPPMEYQITSIHPDSFSYVSSHSLVTICLWGMVIFYLNKYCKNRVLKIAGISVAILWILFVGLSRIWLGVHNPTDVFGAYVLGLVLVTVYIYIEKRLS